MSRASHSTRRPFLRSALALSALVPLGSWLAHDVHAGKNTGKKPQSIADKANDFIFDCFSHGGEPSVDAVKLGGTTVTCTGADGGSVTCTFTSKSANRCSGTSPSMQQFGDVWHLQPITATAATSALPTPLEPGEIEFTLAFISESTPNEGRKRRKRRRGHRH
ncbi:MAG: hypothetical protein M3Z20_13270 [Chloroflexota bacterium]|nr:hypothetical protein [Chloroflexota bacterium]